MKQILSQEFPGFKNFFDNIEYYKTKFVQDSVLSFRNANLSHEEQVFFHQNLGNYFGWYSYKGSGNNYVENHAHNIYLPTSGPDDVMAKWHLEHVYYSNPICASTWSMHKFNTDENNGKTYFIDMSKIYLKLSSEWQTFLDKCTMDSGVSNIPDLFYKSDDYPVVQKHWITDEKVIRIAVTEKIEQSLKYYNGKIPSENEQKTFSEIYTFILNEIWDNKNNIIFHKWNQGDVLIVDIFKLCHSVTGGFKPEEREFRGMWGHRNPISHD